MPTSPLSPLAICESCWLAENTRWEPESIDEQGRIMLRLAGVNMPDMLRSVSVEVCCMCGELTIVGIYVLRDPEIVPYPEPEDEKPFGFVIGMNGEDGLFGEFDSNPGDDCG